MRILKPTLRNGDFIAEPRNDQTEVDLSQVAINFSLTIPPGERARRQRVIGPRLARYPLGVTSGVSNHGIYLSEHYGI
jgi:hypothetical protein